MKIKKYISLAVRCCLVMIFFVGFFVRCASTMTPSGGPKDTLPPSVMTMLPENYTINFEGNKIYITFDEFVQIKNQNTEFFVSPAMEKKPIITTRGRGIVVNLRDDSLRKNTTYALNFGSSIVDNNEGNPLHSYRYVFSTGGEIDSMILSGYTVDGYKAEAVSKSYILFYPMDSLRVGEGYDSTMLLVKPSVIARAEDNGIFIAQNLKPIDYKIYAFEDKNSNQTYEAGVDNVGFIESPYNPATLPDFTLWYDSIRQYVVADPQLHLRLFMDKDFQRQLLQESNRYTKHLAQLSFSAPDAEILSLEFDSIPQDGFILEPSQGENPPQVTGEAMEGNLYNLWFTSAPELIPDTIRGKITYLRHDSLRVLSPVTEDLRLVWTFTETRDQRRERERQEQEREKAEAAGVEWKPPFTENPFKATFTQPAVIAPRRTASVEFEHPLTNFNEQVFQLTSTAPTEGASPRKEVVSVTPDSVNNRLYHISASWNRANHTYELMIPQGALVDIARNTNDTLRTTFTAADPDDHSVLSIKLIGGDAPNYVVELLNASGSLIEAKSTRGFKQLQFDYVKPGDVSLRVLQDDNNNGQWDGGNLIRSIQPERVELFSANGEEIITLRANWEVELDVNLDNLFAPITMESTKRKLAEQERRRLEELARKREEARQKELEQRESSGGFGFSF